MLFSLYLYLLFFFFFFFNDTATTEIYTLSLHDALPICVLRCQGASSEHDPARCRAQHPRADSQLVETGRSEEHTSELQSQFHLVCRLLLEKKKKKKIKNTTNKKQKHNHNTIVSLIQIIY